MSGGWSGGIAVALVAVGLAVCAEGSVRVNGQSVSVEPPVRQSGDSVLVPILAFAPLLGIEAAERDGHIALRWSKGRDELPDAEVHRVSGVAFAEIETLVGYVGGAVRRAGGNLDVEVEKARLLDLAPSGDAVVARLDRFAPTFVSQSSGVDVLRFYDCSVETATRSVDFGPGGVGHLTLVPTGDSSCELRITFLEAASIAVRRLDMGGAYSVSISAAVDSSLESTTVLSDGLSFFESEVNVGDGVAEVAYVRLEDWRGRADVRPLLSPAGAGTQATTSDTMSGSGATVALSSRSGSDLGLVVIDGVPFSVEEESSLALSVDVFGLLGIFTPEVNAFAVSDSARIPLDGVDRPIGYDEAIGYPAGYWGDITRGFPEGFSVVRVRDGVVVSILDAAFVVADPSAMLLVASGVARQRLQGLVLGDRVELVCEVGLEQRFVQHALSIDSVLLWNGQTVDPTGGESRSTAWSVVGADWQGGFFFLTTSSATGLTSESLLALLASLPVPPSSAVVLERGGAGALALEAGPYRVRWGGRAPVAVCLGAVLP